jgi:hypothetical protein
MYRQEGIAPMFLESGSEFVFWAWEGAVPLELRVG